MKKRIVEWVEPFGPNDESVYCRVTEETAIAFQKRVAEKKGHEYSSDLEALEDFMVVRWAHFYKPTKSEYFL